MSVFTEPHLFFGSFRPNPVVTLVDTDGGQADASGNVTLTMDFGAEGNLRELIAVIQTIEDPITGITIGGVTATIHDSANDTAGDSDGTTLTIASARVPTGTSGNVVVSGVNYFFGKGNPAVVNLYRASPLVNRTPHATATDLDNTLSLNLNTQAGGFVIAGGSWISTGSVSMTGVTEDYDDNPGTNDQFASGHAENLASSETPRTVNLDGPLFTSAAGVAVSWVGNGAPL